MPPNIPIPKKRLLGLATEGKLLRIRLVAEEAVDGNKWKTAMCIGVVDIGRPK